MEIQYFFKHTFFSLLSPSCWRYCAMEVAVSCVYGYRVKAVVTLKRRKACFAALLYLNLLSYMSQWTTAKLTTVNFSQISGVHCTVHCFRLLQAAKSFSSCSRQSTPGYFWLLQGPSGSSLIFAPPCRLLKAAPGCTLATPTALDRSIA